MISAQLVQEKLDLELLSAGEGEELAIDTSDINRPGLQFAGFYEYFANDRLQIIGKAEMEYLMSLSPTLRARRLDAYMSRAIPAVVLCRSLPCPEELLKAAAKHKVPLYRSKLVTTKFAHTALVFINSYLAPRVTLHGVLVDVYGIGVMITGESGIGKSESALELIKRGHRLVADDVVDIKQISDERLIGESPEVIRHFMEIRGIGIIDVSAMYGIGAVINSKSIELVIHLQMWDSTKDYDRLGLTEEYINILDVRLPKITVPVRPGRNLSIIIEVAARNYRLRQMGFHAAKELDKRMTAHFAQE